MSFFRKILYRGIGIIFKLLLLLLPLVFGVAVVLGSPSNIEDAAKQSHIYDTVVETVLNNSAKQATDDQTKKLLDQPGVRAAIQKSFPPQLIEQSASSVIQGIFAWLQGKTVEPQFTIDLSEAKANLTDNLTAFGTEHINGLPVCTLAQLQTLQQNSDLLSLPCRPPGIDIAATARQFSEQLTADVDFLDKPVISNETLAGEDGQLLSGDSKKLPQAYQASQVAKWVMLVATIGLALLMIFARRDRLAGIKYVAWSTLGVAFFWIVAMVVYWWLLDKTNQNRASIDATQAALLDGGKVLLTDMNKVIGIFVATYTFIGGGLLVVLRYIRPEQPKKTASVSAKK